MFQKKALWQGLTFAFAFLLSFAIIVALVLEEFRVAVDGALGTVSEVMVSAENDENLYKAYTPPQDVLNADGTGNSTKMITKAIDLGRRQEAEGAVLLKNNGALPLAKSSKVTLLGARSETSIINSGMGQKSQGSYITLAQALSTDKTDFAHTTTNSQWTRISEFNFSDLKYGGDGVAAGAGFQVNPTVLAKYKELNTASKIAIQPSVPSNHLYDPQEPARSEVEDAVTSSMASYGDAAIVVLGRPAGESNDYWKGGVKAGLGFDEPLQLSKNERDILELATEKFDKVIVLLNNNSAIEIGDLKNNDKIDAILWMGHPGNYGFLGVADILCGNVSPSGGLYDIYATNNLSAPAMQNMGKYEFSNKSDITKRGATKSIYYALEVESIYTGYRYYETRYYDSVVNTSSNATSTTGAYASTGAWNYGQEVAYGFGYGMTYSTLKYELVGTPEVKRPSGHEIYADFTVKVTNTGATATKANVQIYGQAPYYKGGVEKSAIQLLGFDKTGLLAANGGTETVKITVDMQNIASYDNTFKNADGTKGAWILDEGDYYFAVGNGAHDALNNVMKKQNYTPDAEANADLAWKWTYNYAGSGTVDGTTFGISKNKTQVSNQIDYIDWNTFGGEKVTYLSRSDWAGTYPKEYVSIAAPADMIPLLNGEYYKLKTDDNVSDIKWDSTSTEYKFYQMVKSDFDDYRWEALLDQLNLAEATAFAELGGPKFYELTGVGFTARTLTDNAGNGMVFRFAQSQVPDAPWAIKEGDANYDWNGQVFGCAPIMASTFDPEIMNEIGEFVGVEALFLGYPIVWGPGLNTHRHAYNGRNGEYYSEDPVLAGVAAMEFAVGARDYGLIAAAKHYVFNDQETQRNGIAPFMTEQRAREIELRAYQIAIEAVKYNTYNVDASTVREKKTGLYGLMTSFSKCGPVEVTCSWGMLTGILQNEWGFTGYAVSDIGDDRDLFSSAVYAGLTGFDNRGSKKTGPEELAGMAAQNDSGTERGKVDGTYFQGDATLQKAVKQSIKRTLWALSNSNLMNQYTASTHVESQMTWWRGLYIGLIVAFSVLTAAAVAMYVLSVLKGKKEA